MKGPFKAVKISDHVHWVGAIDWDMRDFHGYSTERGSTYNAYLVMGDEIVLIDTVKALFKDEFLSRIASVVDPKEISYIISNHSEMDHTGCLPEIIEAVKPKKVLASIMGAKAIYEHFGIEDIETIKDGESVGLGNMDFSFLETRMLHWPDSMFTYLANDNILFSQDAFGMHLATSERFTDEVEDDIVRSEAAKYYANILLPYSKLVSNILKKVGETDWDIRMIASDHGPVWRKDIEAILNLYAGWAAQKPAMKAVVVYDTMWQATSQMAQAICEGLSAGGVKVVLMKMQANPRSVVTTEVFDAGALIVGSPTLNNQIFPTVVDILWYLKGLRPQNLIGAAFGSYGWSGEAVSQIEDILREMKVELVSESVRVKYVPTDEDLERCFALGSLVAERLKEMCGGS